MYQDVVTNFYWNWNLFSVLVKKIYIKIYFSNSVNWLHKHQQLRFKNYLRWLATIWSYCNIKSYNHRLQWFIILYKHYQKWIMIKSNYVLKTNSWAPIPFLCISKYALSCDNVINVRAITYQCFMWHHSNISWITKN